MSLASSLTQFFYSNGSLYKDHLKILSDKIFRFNSQIISYLFLQLFFELFLRVWYGDLSLRKDENWRSLTKLLFRIKVNISQSILWSPILKSRIYLWMIVYLFSAVCHWYFDNHKLCIWKKNWWIARAKYWYFTYFLNNRALVIHFTFE